MRGVVQVLREVELTEEPEHPVVEEAEQAVEDPERPRHRLALHEPQPAPEAEDARG